MSERDGIETILTLRQEYPEIGVMAMSERVETSASYLGLVAPLGAHRTLTKPFSEDQLRVASDDPLASSLVKHG